MPLKTPFKLGPFEIDNQGQILPLDGDTTPGFTVRWRGRMVHARLSPNTPDLLNMSLKARLGRVPSTGAGNDGDVRVKAFDVVRALPGALPDGWRIRLMPDHQFRLEIETHVDAPTTATALITQLTICLLHLSPYLDTLDEAGVTARAT